MIAAALPAAARRLQTVSDSPRLDAELLLAHALACDRSALIARSDEKLQPAQIERFEQLLERRGTGAPLAYLTGRREFWSLTLQVTPDVLIPRPETELLVEWGLERLAGIRAPAILDLGTGSGCIALALAKERSDAQVRAIDASSAALAVAQTNARNLGLSRVSFEQVEFSDVTIAAACDLVVSNPPYVAPDDSHLAALAHEPALALVSEPDGLSALREICARAPPLLKPGGWLLLEHGFDQGAAVRELLAAAGFLDVETRRDLAGHERASGGRRPR